MITGTVPIKIPEVPRRVTEGVRIIANAPHMEELEESRYVFLEAGKRWYYGTESQAIELREEV